MSESAPQQRPASGRVALGRDNFEYTARDPGKPQGIAFRQFFATGTRLRFVAKRGENAVLEASRTVQEVLRSPKVVWTGIRWEGDESPDGDGWACYAGRPKTRYYNDGPGPSRPNRVFLVFVTNQGVIYTWRWEEAEESTGLPTKLDGRFKQQVIP